MAKKISTVEIRLYTLTAKNVIATSLGDGTLGKAVKVDDEANMFVSGRDYYDEEEW